MRYVVILILVFSNCISTWAQSEEEHSLKVSLQTDLLAYTTPGGWSAWVSAQYNRYKLSLAYVNYPNRFRSMYEETGIQENPQWLRIQLSRQFKPSSKLRNFFYGINIEHQWRELVEDNNPDEILNDTYWKLGLFAGYEWTPWQENEHALRNLSFIFWGGISALPTNNEMSRVFENTVSVYDIPGIFRSTIGINVSYIIFQQ